MRRYHMKHILRYRCLYKMLPGHRHTAAAVKSSYHPRRQKLWNGREVSLTRAAYRRLKANPI